MKRLNYYNCLIVLFLGGWILPIVYYGLVDSAPPWLPKIVAERANVSRLFDRESSTLTVFAIEASRSKNGAFEPLRELDYFTMRPFGFRTRMQRFLERASPASRRIFAEWVVTQDGRSNLITPITRLRIVSFPRVSPGNERLEGHYLQPELDSMPDSKIRIIDEFYFPGS